MGSWTETCAITNQPLIGPAYCVVIPYETCFNIRMMQLDRVRIAKGTLDCFGTLYDITEKTDDGDFSIDIYHESDEEISVIFIGENAWDAVVKRIKKKGIQFRTFINFEKEYGRFYKHFTNYSEMTKLHFEWYLIEHFLHHIRRSFINNNEFSGSQDEAYDELLFANSLIQIPEKED